MTESSAVRRARPRVHWRHGYPFEPFVQQAITRHFVQEGFTAEPTGHPDLVSYSNAHGIRWVIALRGKSNAPGGHWREGLGRIITAMQQEDAAISYGVAMPATRHFQEIRTGISSWVRRTLRLHWLVVTEDGSVTIIAPPS